MTNAVKDDVPLPGPTLVPSQRNLQDGQELLSLSSPVLTRKAAARYIGVAPQTLASWACSKKVDLPYTKVGRKAMYHRSDLDQFLLRNRQAANQIVIWGAHQ